MVKHLVMLGTPNQGSACADRIEALYDLRGINSMATWQLRPKEVTEFNKRVTDLRGVQASVLAGTRLLDFACVGEADPDFLQPNDLVVTKKSAQHGFTDVGEMGILHICMTGGDKAKTDRIIDWAICGGSAKDAFTDFVLPRLAVGPQGARALASAVKPPVTSTTAEDTGPAPQLILSARPTLAAGDGVDLPIIVPTSSAFGIVVIAPVTVTTTLRDPAGTVVQTVAANTLPAEQPFRTFRVENPTVGTWTLRLDNQDSADVQSIISAFVEGNPLVIDLKTRAPSADRQVQLTVALMNNGAAVPAAKITAYAVGVDQAPIVLDLLDDGMHGDSLAGDGIYSATTASLRLGSYFISAHAQVGSELRITTDSVEVGTEAHGTMLYLPLTRR